MVGKKWQKVAWGLLGTNLAMVVERRRHELKVIYAEEEFYEERSLLDEAARRERELGREVELIWRQEVGHRWLSGSSCWMLAVSPSRWFRAWRVWVPAQAFS